jgi:hypothetical protein
MTEKTKHNQFYYTILYYMTAWNDFVKKIYHEGHDKDPSYQFKTALKDASRRKGEMGTSKTSKTSKNTKKTKGTRKKRRTRRR